MDERARSTSLEPLGTDGRHAAEWLRALLSVGVVAYHAAVAYTVWPQPGMAWACFDGSKTFAADLFCWTTIGFNMPVFFVLSGLATAHVQSRRDPIAFLRDRTVKLIPPLALASITVLPLALVLWMVCWIAQGRLSSSVLLTLGLESPAARPLFGSAHLWYVQYLWTYCAIAALAGAVSGRTKKVASPAPAESSGLISAVWMPLVLAIPAGVLLGIQPHIAIGFVHTLFPEPSKFLYFAMFFGLGYGLYRTGHVSRALERGSELRLLASFAVLPLLVLLIPRFHRGLLAGVEYWGFAGIFGLYVSLSTMGVLGCSWKYLRSTPPAVIRYLSETSYWVYLVHLPLVGLTQFALMRLSVPAEAKWLVATALPVALCLAAYEVAVRRTWLGSFLEGRSASPAIDVGVAPSAPVLVRVTA